MTTNNLEILGINRTQVVYGEDQTIFVTPFRPGGYAFRVAASLYKIEPPKFQHGQNGDIVTFSKQLSTEEAKFIGKYANAGEVMDFHHPATPQALEEQMCLARLVTGLSTEV